jgi:hypothetical protein
MGKRIPLLFPFAIIFKKCPSWHKALLALAPTMIGHHRCQTCIIVCIVFILSRPYKTFNSKNTSLDHGIWLQAIHQCTDCAKIAPPSIRMSFQLQDPNTLELHLLPTTWLRCPSGEFTIGRREIPTGQNRTGELPQSLMRADDDFGRGGRVFDFTVTMSTNLKLILVGNLVMVQLSQVIDESLGGRDVEARNILWNTGGVHEGGTVLAPTRGGGVSATWRMTGLLSKSNMGRLPANSGGGGYCSPPCNPDSRRVILLPCLQCSLASFSALSIRKQLRICRSTNHPCKSKLWPLPLILFLRATHHPLPGSNTMRCNLMN